MSTPTTVPKQLPEGHETYIQKGWRKCKEQPIVPLGVLATCVAFLGATRSMRSGDRASFNRFLRFRVLAQGITVLGCVAGAWYIGREARLGKMAEQVEDARLGRRTAREGTFDEGLEGRMREAERLSAMEERVESRPPATAPASTSAGKT